MITLTFTTVAMLLLAGVPLNAQEPTRVAIEADAHYQLQIVSQRSQHHVLTGMGMRLRQMTDWFVYEHFELADQTGMVVENLLANLPANKAGIQWHDIIAKVDGKSISSIDEFVAAYKACKSDTVPVEIIQKGRLKTVNIDKAEVAKREKVFRIGVHVHSVHEELALHLGLLSGAKRGLFVSDVAVGSPAGKVGLQDGDILIKANGKWLKSRDTLNNLVRESQGKVISMEFLRAGKERKVKIAAEELPNGHYGQMTQQNPFLDIIGLSAADGIHYRSRQRDVDAAVAMERVLKAVDQLTKDVSKLRAELKEKE